MILSTTLLSSFIAVSTPNIEKNESTFLIQEDKEIRLSYIEKYADLKTEIETYKTFEKNWDGYNADIISNKTISNAKRFLSLLEDFNILKPIVFPRTFGEIGIYWKNKNNYIEVSISELEEISYFYDLDGEVFGEENLAISIIPIKMKEAIEKIRFNTTSESNTVVTKNENNSKLVA